MRLISLNSEDRQESGGSEWRLYYYQEDLYDIQRPADLEAQALKSIPAEVPGNVELDLVRAGVLPEPFYGTNIRRLREYETCSFWYMRTFDMHLQEYGGQVVELVFEGLDALAAVWLNGEKVGESANALIEQRFNVSLLLKPGKNRLHVQLRSALNFARGQTYDAASMSWEGREEGLFIRKPPHCWGWDILPRAVSAGIWRDVWLEARPADRIEQVYYYTSRIDAQGAELAVRYQVRTAGAIDGLRLEFEGVCGGERFAFTWPLEFTAGGCRIPIPGAKLWWPRGYGDANLYTVSVRLVRGEGAGRVLDERTEQVGLRTLKLERTELGGLAWSPPEAGEGAARVDTPPDGQHHFYFTVNGVKIAIRGSNWVPLDAFHSRDAGRLEQAMQMVEELGCNMLRCWGGNVYEEHAFFERCDELGVLVWQDFAFACCRYPQTEDFLGQVRAEAEAVVTKLRNHASLAVWCGDNEIDMAYLSDGLSPACNRLTREVLPQVVARLDPQRPFVPSSPYVPPAVEAVSEPWMRTPEQHLWGPRGYFKSGFYTEHSAHFIGEIGYHGCPNRSTLERFLPADRLWPWQGNEDWQVHSVYHWRHGQVERDRIRLMANQVKELFGRAPEELGEFILASQITQAEAKKFFIESTRLRKWHTSGVLWWNLLDGWPQFSDAVVDYYFGKKLAYHYIRRAQAPVGMAMGEPGKGGWLGVVLLNDTRAAAQVGWRVWEAGGETLEQGSFNLGAGENWQVGRVGVKAGEQRMLLYEWEVGGRRTGGHYLAGSPPFALERYKEWLGLIAGLEPGFDAGGVGK